jgi:hypothetical protein
VRLSNSWWSLDHQASPDSTAIEICLDRPNDAVHNLRAIENSSSQRPLEAHAPDVPGPARSFTECRPFTLWASYRCCSRCWVEENDQESKLNRRRHRRCPQKDGRAMPCSKLNVVGNRLIINQCNTKKCHRGRLRDNVYRLLVCPSSVFASFDEFAFSIVCADTTLPSTPPFY